MSVLKRVVRRAVNALGYDISRIPGDEDVSDIDLYYELYGNAVVESRSFYNIGAGDFRHPAWTNVDHRSDWYAEVQGDRIGIDWDLLSLTPLPVADDCAEVVYSSHTVEHVTDRAAANMFKEAHRILKKGRVFRVTSPNVDLALRAYRGNDRHYFYWIGANSTPEAMQRVKLVTPLSDASLQQILLWHFAATASILHADGSPERIDDEEFDRVFRELPCEEALDYCVSKCSLEVQRRYPGNHVNWWNPRKASRMLKAAGFAEVEVSAYGQSRVPVLRNTALFDSTNPKVSFHIEAIK